MKVEAYIHSLKDLEHGRNVLGEAEIIRKIGDNLYLAEYRGVQCTAILILLLAGISLMMCMVCR